MLKFFRKYNMYILAVGATLLMIAFLIEPTISSFMPTEGNIVIGTVRDGADRITVQQERLAQAELESLRMLGLRVDLDGENAALRWLLALEDARQMGLSASEFEINQLLMMLGMSTDDLRQVGGRYGMSNEAVRNMLRSWLVFQQYRELALGLGHLSLDERLQLYMTASQFFRQAQQMPALGYLFLERAFATMAASQGQPRLSEPLLQRFLHDQLATVKLTAVAVPAGRRLGEEIAPPTEEKLQALFEQYRDRLPRDREMAGPADDGQRLEPGMFPFGYRTPDRVKLEYLAVPLALVQQRVMVDEAEALAYYEANKDQYTTTVPQEEQDMLTGTRRVRPYSEVRGEIVNLLRRQHAAALADQIIREARAILLEDARGLEQRQGYRVLPDDWAPMSLTTVQERIQQDERFGVLVSVRSDDRRWLDRRAVEREAGIGLARTQGNRPVELADYAFATREIAPESPLAVQLRLQTKLPSQPLVGPEGTRYLFRLIDAQAARSPETLDEVRDQVTQDARLVAAYEKLLSEREDWLNRARSEGLESMARASGLELISPEPLPRRDFQTGRPAVPFIRGIGRSDELIDNAFDLAIALSEEAGPDADLSQLPPADRLVDAAVNASLALVIARVDELRPISRQDFEQVVREPSYIAFLNAALISDTLSDDDEADPLSLTSLAKRVGYVER